MKRLLAPALILAATSAFGAPTFGTKSDVTAGMQTSSSGVGMMPFLQMMIALGIVIGLVKFVLPKLATKLSKKIITGVTSQIRIEESASFAGGNLYIVNAKNKTLLISAATTGVTCLADLTEVGTKPEKPLFMEILEQEEREPSGIYVEPDGEPTAAMRSSLNDDEIQAALDRLSQLGAK